MSKWLDWQPSDSLIMTDSHEGEPTKPTKATFDSFGSAPSRENPIIQPAGQEESGDQIIGKPPSSKPTKPTEPTPSLHSAESATASGLPAKPCGACHSRRFWVSIHGATICAICHPPASPRLLQQWIDLSDPEMPKQPESSGEMAGDCPFSLPKGVSLVGYEKKGPKVALAVYSVVEDVPKFIRHALAELDARLRSPIQIKAGDSVFLLLSKLADCGLELRLEWEPQGNGLRKDLAQ